MQIRRLARTCLVALALVSVSGLASSCQRFEPPYAPGAEPSVEDLIAAAAPPLSSIQVPRAKVRQGGSPAANLMIVGQAPARFSGTIQIAGNELVTLAVNEDSYGLRWVGGREGATSLAPGYYEGPPSRCAVQTLLGVDLEPEAFVNVVLGGAPLIDGPHGVLDRRWDRKTGRERLRITNGIYEQELSFAWQAGAWHFAGASLWLSTTEGPSWLWTISHEALHEVDGVLLPEKTEIRQPKPRGRGEQVLHVSYQKQIPNPPLGGELSPDPPPDLPANAGDSFEDDWDDEDGWEDGEDDGWEDGDNGENGEDGEAGDNGEAADNGGEQPDASEVAAEPKPEPRPKPELVETVIPPQFVGNPTGLTPRGDLCAGRQ